MNRITLFVDGDGWMARWTGPHAAEVEALFGTAEIPTPFLSTVPASQVHFAVSQLNPGVDVVVGGAR